MKVQDKKFCFVVFSHADSEEKKEILKKSLLSIKQIEFPIILTSHLVVPEESQNLVDYFVKDSDNLIVDESDIYNPKNNFEITEKLYYVHDVYGGIKFSTNTFKKTYQPGVFNLYINSLHFAQKIGFTNIILWEFDFLLGPDSAKSLRKIINDYLENDHKFFFLWSQIQELPCMNAIPSIINTDLLCSILPPSPIQDPKDFVGISNLMIMEQWMLYNLKKTKAKNYNLDFANISEIFPDLGRGQVHSQNGSFMFFNLRSGVYFSESGEKIIYYTNNCSSIELNSKLEICDRSGNVLYQNEHSTKPSWWAFDFIPDEILHLCSNKQGVVIKEQIQEIDSDHCSTFEYVINSENLAYVSKLKKFSQL